MTVYCSNHAEDDMKPTLSKITLSNIAFPSFSILNIASRILWCIARSTSMNMDLFPSSSIMSIEWFIAVCMTRSLVGDAQIGGR